jgi:RNA polymerase sigma-70 factor, ECF subfamily
MSSTPPTRGQTAHAFAAATDDASLVARVRAGDYEAFSTIFRAHHATLVAFARAYTRTEAEAEDVVQDVFVRVWDRRADWRVRESVRAYLFGATRNYALNAVRDRGTAERWAEAVAQEPTLIGLRAEPASPDAALNAAELDAVVTRAIARLPHRARLVYTLRWRHGLTYAEIADTLAISLKTVESQIRKALSRVRRALANYK